MSFQSEVNKTLAVGNAGDVANTQGGMNVISGVAVSDIAVGSFVKKGTNDNEIAALDSYAATSDVLLGVAIKGNFVNSESDTDTYKSGSNVSVLTQGSVFIKTSETATQGQYVFIKNSDGSVAFDSTSTKSDYSLTGFRVLVGNESGDGVVLITTALPNA